MNVDKASRTAVVYAAAAAALAVTAPIMSPRLVDAESNHEIVASASETTIVGVSETIVNETDGERDQADRALRNLIISRLGDESKDQGDDEAEGDDAMVLVRWEPGVGFVKRG